MNDVATNDAAPRDNRTIRALRSIKEYAEHVARDALSSPVNDLTKRAVKTVFEVGLPRAEQNAALEAALAIVDVATSVKESCDDAAQKSAKEAEAATIVYERFAREETRSTRVVLGALFSSASFAASLYFHADRVAVVAFVCFLVVLLPELGGAFVSLFTKGEPRE